MCYFEFSRMILESRCDYGSLSQKSCRSWSHRCTRSASCILCRRSCRVSDRDARYRPLARVFLRHFWHSHEHLAEAWREPWLSSWHSSRIWSRAEPTTMLEGISVFDIALDVSDYLRQSSYVIPSLIQNWLIILVNIGYLRLYIKLVNIRLHSKHIFCNYEANFELPFTIQSRIDRVWECPIFSVFDFIKQFERKIVFI